MTLKTCDYSGSVCTVPTVLKGDVQDDGTQERQLRPTGDHRAQDTQRTAVGPVLLSSPEVNRRSARGVT